MNKTIVDYESFYDLKNGVSVSVQGVDNYVRDADAYCVSIVDDEFEFCGTIDHARAQFPASFWLDSSREFWSANSNFEQGWTEKYWPESKGMPRPWQCILDLAKGNQMPGDVAQLTRVALGAKVDKSIRDNMNGVRFESLAEEKQQVVLDYCLNDSLEEKRAMLAMTPLTPIEAEIAALTRLQNRRGVGIDLDRVEQDLTKLHEIRHRAFKAIPWHLTDKPLSVKAMGRFCELNGIQMPPSLDKRDEECTEMMSNDPRLKGIIETLRAFRQSNTRIEKASSLKDRVNASGKLPMDLLYCGAPHTRRWSSQGFNVQNLEKEPIFLEKVLATDSTPPDRVFTSADGRTKIDLEKSNYVWAREWLVPSPGKKFLILDLSQIEPRCMNWLVNNEEMLSLIRSGFGIYEAYALSFKGWKGDKGTLKKTNPALYAACKSDFLGLGYGMGWEKYQVKAAEVGVILTEEEARKSVMAYRAQNPKIVKFWAQLDAMLKNAILSPDKGLQIEMPTGEFLRYFHIQQTLKTNAETGRKSVSYSASKTRGIFDSRGRLYNLWGGAMCENVTQRMARDVFGAAMVRLEKAGFPVIFHAHDEAILEVDAGSDKFLADAKDEAEHLLTITPDWAEGLPLAAEGDYADRYCK